MSDGQNPAPAKAHWAEKQDPDFAAIWAQVKPFTMTSPERGYALYQAVHHVIDQDIPGAFVEVGVWKGGSSMLIALTLLARGITDRNLVLIDTFEGMTEAGARDSDVHGIHADDLLAGSRGDAVADLTRAEAGIDQVRTNMAATGYPAARLRIAKADARHDLPKLHTSMIAMLRLDTDFYDSTLAELEQLYPRVSQSAPVIIDDYGHWQGCRDAVETYFEQDPKHARPMMWAVDYTGRVFLKPEPPLKADIERYDYVPPGFTDPKLLGLFPQAAPMNPWIVRWKYLRPVAPHIFRTDSRREDGPYIGYSSYEEALCLHNLAAMFKGKRGLEIGSHYGWTSAHLRAAGLRMDHVDIAFADPEREAQVRKALDAVDSDQPYKIWSDPSPGCVDTVAASDPDPWSFAFIDGYHEAPAPAQDARAVLPHMAEDAVTVFHDLTSPDVCAGLDIFRDAGWNVMLWNTMQVLGIAWRGNVTLPNHVPDPNVARLFQPHLAGYTTSNDSD